MGLFSRKPRRGDADPITAMYAPPRPQDVADEQPADADPELVAAREKLEEHLLGEDLEGAMVVAYEYAFALTESEGNARELVRRARTLLWERATWDWDEYTLREYLCGVVKSLFSNDARAAVLRAEKEGEVVAEAKHLGETRAQSPEQLAIDAEEREQRRATASGQLEELRRAFVRAGDKVNVQWLDFQLQGIEEPAEMAKLSRRNVRDFYLAADRRKRHVARILAERRAADAKEKEEDDERGEEEEEMP